MYPRQNFVTHKKKIERRPCVFHFSFFVFFSFKYMYNIEEGGGRSGGLSLCLGRNWRDRKDRRTDGRTETHIEEHLTVYINNNRETETHGQREMKEVCGK